MTEQLNGASPKHTEQIIITFTETDEGMTVQMDFSHPLTEEEYDEMSDREKANKAFVAFFSTKFNELLDELKTTEARKKIIL